MIQIPLRKTKELLHNLKHKRKLSSVAESSLFLVGPV